MAKVNRLAFNARIKLVVTEFISRLMAQGPSIAWHIIRMPVVDSGVGAVWSAPRDRVSEEL